MESVLVALLLAGLMGMLGQGVRAVVGLKGLADEMANPNASNVDVFSAARLVVSLIIGFIAGVAAGIVVGLDKIVVIAPADTKVLLSLCAAGYAGTDFIEGFMASYLPGQAPAIPAAVSPVIAPAAFMAPMAGALPVKQLASGGDAKVRAACEAEWDAFKADCSGFVRAVGAQLGAEIQGDADAIVQALRSGGKWQHLANGPAATTAAQQGRFVVCGLEGSGQAVKDTHGHVVVIVDGPLNRGKYPTAYWGKLGGVGAKNQTINWAWTAEDRDNVVYAAYEP